MYCQNEVSKIRFIHLHETSKKKKYRKTHGTITIKTVVNIALKYSDSQEVGIKQEQPEPYGCPRLPPGEGV